MLIRIGPGPSLITTPLSQVIVTGLFSDISLGVLVNVMAAHTLCMRMNRVMNWVDSELPEKNAILE